MKDFTRIYPENVPNYSDLNTCETYVWPVTLTLIAERLAVELSLPVLTT